MGQLSGIVRAKRPTRRPEVLTRSEAARVIAALPIGPYRTIALLLYGSGLRLNEACSLRVKDVDFERSELTIRQGKGNRDRLTMLADSARELLLPHFDALKAHHLRELAIGRGRVTLPTSFHRKSPAAGRERRLRADSLVTPSGTPSLHIYWRPTTTFEPSKSCSAMAM